MLLKEPGGLSDLGQEAKQEWHDEIEDLVTRSIRRFNSKHFQLLPDEEWDLDPSVVDWDGFPRILQNCLGDEKASEFCDWKTSLGDKGRVLGQDEYCEWRTVHDQNGKLIRVEVTTELAKYWEVLAGHHPMTALRVLGRFAGEAMADWRDVYGINPFDPGVSIEDRQSAFNSRMLYRGSQTPVKSPYNNGQKAIAFLSKPVSSLSAAIQLFVAASIPYGKDDGGVEVVLNGPEAISSTSQAAIDCRNSDPNMVELMNKMVWDGKAVAFDDPVGVYIRSFASNVLLDPDGNPIPNDWIEFQRGSRPNGGVGEERSQRLVIEVPPEMGFVLEDLINKDTNENIKYGYQIAELVKLACYFRTSADNAIAEPRKIVRVNPLAQCSSNSNCRFWKDLYDEFEEEQIVPEMEMNNISRTGEVME